MIKNKKLKKIILILIIVLLTALVGYGVYIWIYYDSIQTANKEFYEEWYKEEYLPASFKGVVISKKSYDFEDRNFTVIEIETAPEKILTLDICKMKDPLFIGDTVQKKRDNKTLYLRENQKLSDLEIQFCK